jgi:hypothetical protein
MNIDSIKDADDAIAYFERLATEAKHVSRKLNEFSRQQTTYNAPANRFLKPNGDDASGIDAATASKCHGLATAGQDFFVSVFGTAF